MARVPDATGIGEVAERIRQRRPGGQLRPVDHMLLHAPRLADGWNSLIGTLRAGVTLPDVLREMVVMRIAVLNDAPYEWDSHLADANRAGIDAAGLAALRSAAVNAVASSSDLAVFDDTQRAVLRLTDVMTRDLRVPDVLFDELVDRLGLETLIELVVAIGAYNMVSRVVVALEITTAGGAQ